MDIEKVQFGELVVLAKLLRNDLEEHMYTTVDSLYLAMKCLTAAKMLANKVIEFDEEINPVPQVSKANSSK
jgi:hypothetical protein